MDPHHTNKILLNEQQLAARVDALAAEMAATYHGKDFVLIGVLRGSFMFLADLVRAMHRQGLAPCIDFMTLESYGGGTQSSGVVRVIKDVSVDVRTRPVLLVDDILDSGRTLRFATQHLANKGCENVKSCTLLDKPSRRVIAIEADFVGFPIDDLFVVGYGLDYDTHYRELPYIAEVTFVAPE